MNIIVILVIAAVVFMAGVAFGENNRNADLNGDQKLDGSDFMKIIRPENRRE